MDFGRSLDIQEFERIDFKLPEFTAIENRETTHFYLGGTQWSSNSFKGTLYPWNAKKDDFLSLYASQFNSIELNTTYHSIPSENIIYDWVSQIKLINPHFKFCPKIPKAISHEGRLDSHFDLIPQFVKAIEKFDQHLGVCFLQLSPHFSPRSFDLLKGFFDLWPKDIPLAVELRHAGWFNKNLFRPLHEFLLQKKSSLVITDTHLRRDVLHSHIFPQHLLIRFVGNSFHSKDQERLAAWAKLLPQLNPQQIYFFIHEDEESFFHTSQHMGKLISENFPIHVPTSIQRMDYGQLNLF